VVRPVLTQEVFAFPDAGEDPSPRWLTVSPPSAQGQ